MQTPTLDTAQRETTGPALLLLGALSGVLVMAHHPHAGTLSNARHFFPARLNIAVHSFAIAAAGCILLGLIALGRRLGRSELTTAALVAFGFAIVAVVNAACASGFVATDLIARIADRPAGPSELDRALLDYTHLFNQAFAKVFVVASSLSIALFSAAILRTGRMSRWLGAAGGLAALLIVAGLLTGRLTLDVAGFGLVTLVQSVWYAGAAVWMLRG